MRTVKIRSRVDTLAVSRARMALKGIARPTVSGCSTLNVAVPSLPVKPSHCVPFETSGNVADTGVSSVNFISFAGVPTIVPERLNAESRLSVTASPANGLPSRSFTVTTIGIELPFFADALGRPPLLVVLASSCADDVNVTLTPAGCGCARQSINALVVPFCVMVPSFRLMS